MDIDALAGGVGAQFGDWIRACYGAPVARTSGSGSVITLTLNSTAQGVAVDRVWIREVRAPWDTPANLVGRP